MLGPSDVGSDREVFDSSNVQGPCDIPRRAAVA